ncbi:hypothetical protein SHI21_02395 [Bacteriovorax sp. PP10]|jgi:hypothetical protein|uniref:Uncharacterized protein n=1 Tax=Bacteriovorax antarcticus TaxID=3088717 RepID=A0ABU5VPQ5_9BACT|nr:hypothetical protein [Bacteriovorax sp. PP10]MEA9355029.1 hypothetical protein [Bacteriovorax sp. PP10]
MSKFDNTTEANLTHDINATLSSLLSALELVNDEWKTNPELVDKILPLTTQKLDLLREQLLLYRNSQN